MKKERRQLLILLLVTLLTLSWSFRSFAAEEELLSLQYSTEEEDGTMVFVSVDAKKSGVVADGTLTISYDSDIIRFLGAKSGDAWGDPESAVVVGNVIDPGTLTVTFAGDQYAEIGSLLNIKFKVLKQGEAFVKIEGEKSKITGAQGYVLNAEVMIDVSNAVAVPDPVDPTPPMPIDPPNPAPTPTPTPTPQKPEEPSKPEPKPTPTPAPTPAPTPKPTEEPKEVTFVDVNEGDYFKIAVDYVLSKGYMSGVSDTQFAPHVLTDRAMTITILWRMAGKPEAKVAAPFKDVLPTDYYADAVAWAYENGIVKGRSAEAFGSDMQVTREQLVAFLMRFAEIRGFSPKVSGDLSAFSDANTVSEYAVKGLTWAVNNGFVTGTDANTLSPKGLATRAQLATIITRFANMYMK